MAVITLLTDFGTKDGFVGTMKGVIWQIIPTAQIADITHEIKPQNVMEGAIALWRAAPFFPEGTVHIGVVDPGVGTGRRLMAARIGEHYFVGPDNGLFTPLIESAKKAGKSMTFVQLDQPQYWLPAVSHTFHGRDVFAPVGAHLAAGVSLESMGKPFTDPVLLSMLKPQKTANGFTAHITIADVFGNLTTDLPASEIIDRDITINFKGRQINSIAPSYGHRQPGEIIALVDSEDFLEIAVVNGSAAKVTGGKVGDAVEVIINNEALK